MVQQDICLYDIQDLEPEEIADRMRIRKKQARERRMGRIRRAAEIQAEKVERLKRELWIAHKRSRTEDGVLGIVWWNRVSEHRLRDEKVEGKKGGTINTFFTYQS